jgi:hypothetical protein
MKRRGDECVMYTGADAALAIARRNPSGNNRWYSFNNCLYDQAMVKARIILENDAPSTRRRLVAVTPHMFVGLLLHAP